jgi:hypothetical protein
MKVLQLIILCLSFTVAKAQVIGVRFDVGNALPKTGVDVLNRLHKKHKNGPCKAYTFSQKNTHYRNDSVIRQSEWHEAIEFPSKFRINFGDSTQGNFVIFKNDSSYNFKNFQLKKTSYNANTLLLLLGGMYYRDFNEVITRLEKEHYNTRIVSTQKWAKEEVEVIGALIGDTLSNQIWVSKKHNRVVRIIEKWDEGRTMDMTFDAYQKHCNGYVETKVTFKSNGKVEQVEEYYNIRTVTAFPDEVFNPKSK